MNFHGKKRQKIPKRDKKILNQYRKINVWPEDKYKEINTN